MTCSTSGGKRRQRGGSNCSGGDAVQEGGVQGFQFGGKRRRTKKYGKKMHKKTGKKRKTKRRKSRHH